MLVHLKRIGNEVYYHKGNHECDFVIKSGTKITQAIQVCSQLHSDNIDLEISGLQEVMQTYQLKEGILLTLDTLDDIFSKGKKIRIMPAWKWLLS